jgi:hypothetical protein
VADLWSRWRSDRSASTSASPPAPGSAVRLLLDVGSARCARADALTPLQGLARRLGALWAPQDAADAAHALQSQLQSNQDDDCFVDERAVLVAALLDWWIEQRLQHENLQHWQHLLPSLHWVVPRSHVLPLDPLGRTLLPVSSSHANASFALPHRHDVLFVPSHLLPPLQPPSTHPLPTVDLGAHRHAYFAAASADHPIQWALLLALVLLAALVTWFRLLRHDRPR